MLALELADGQKKLLDPENIRALNYLPNAVSDLNPYGLPVGFVKDAGDENNAHLMCKMYPRLCANGILAKDWIGLNCSACHTNEISYQNMSGQTRTVRIDGGATLADFQKLLERKRCEMAT
jgi:hypothetical protein